MKPDISILVHRLFATSTSELMTNWFPTGRDQCLFRKQVVLC